MNAHTPGPWNFKKVAVWAPTTPTEGIPVFEFCFTGGEEWMRTARANARIIAAAPELLAACRELIRHFCPSTDRMSAEANRAFEDAMAAIAKAKGSK